LSAVLEWSRPSIEACDRCGVDLCAVYAVQSGRLREVDDWLDRFRAFWLPRLDALATEVARGKRKRRQQK